MFLLRAFLASPPIWPSHPYNLCQTEVASRRQPNPAFWPLFLIDSAEIATVGSKTKGGLVVGGYLTLSRRSTAFIVDGVELALGGWPLVARSRSRHSQPPPPVRALPDPPTCVRHKAPLACPAPSSSFHQCASSSSVTREPCRHLSSSRAASPSRQVRSCFSNSPNFAVFSLLTPAEPTGGRIGT